MTITIDLKQYYGPMDLLLSLIEKEKIDIYEIPISRITDQYLQVIHASTDHSPDELTDFILMASTLVELKSKSLLPRKLQEETDQQAILSKEDLVRKLIEYKKFKEISELFKEYEKRGAKIFTKLQEDLTPYMTNRQEEFIPENPQLLHQIISYLMQKTSEDQHFQMSSVLNREEYSVESYIQRIKEIMLEKGNLQFHEIILKKDDKQEQIVLFISTLELIKTGFLRVVQPYPGDPIFLQLR